MPWRASDPHGLHRRVGWTGGRSKPATHGYFELIWQLSCRCLRPFRLQKMRAANVQRHLFRNDPVGNHGRTTCALPCLAIRRRLLDVAVRFEIHQSLQEPAGISIWRAFTRALLRGFRFHVLSKIRPRVCSVLQCRWHSKIACEYMCTLTPEGRIHHQRSFLTLPSLSFFLLSGFETCGIHCSLISLFVRFLVTPSTVASNTSRHPLSFQLQQSIPMLAV